MEHYFFNFVSCAFYALIGVIIMLAASLIFSVAILLISDIYDKVLANLGKGKGKRLAFLEKKHDKLVNIIGNIDDYIATGRMFLEISVQWYMRRRACDYAT